MIRGGKNTNIHLPQQGARVWKEESVIHFWEVDMKRDTEMHLQWHCSTPTFSEFLNTQDGGMHILLATSAQFQLLKHKDNAKYNLTINF